MSDLFKHPFHLRIFISSTFIKYYITDAFSIVIKIYSNYYLVIHGEIVF